MTCSYMLNLKEQSHNGKMENDMIVVNVSDVESVYKSVKLGVEDLKTKSDKLKSEATTSKN